MDYGKNSLFLFLKSIIQNRASLPPNPEPVLLCLFNFNFNFIYYYYYYYLAFTNVGLVMVAFSLIPFDKRRCTLFLVER